MVLHWVVQKHWVKMLFLVVWRFFGTKRPKFFKNQGVLKKWRILSAPKKISVGFFAYDFGYLHNISWSACVPNQPGLKMSFTCK